MELRATILRAVLDAGFDRAGCLPLDQASDPGLAAWIEAGRHGSMAYLERHVAAREDPVVAFPLYRSVIVAALEYGEVAPAPKDPTIGNISRYALGDDYHEVLKSRLLAAADQVRAAVPGLRARAFVDAGPLNEKAIAAKAGLGFVGKHTNLIDVGRGSYFFLGLLLVDVELEPTGPPEKDRCGLCEACIPACPTGAIVAPYVLDARRCISYLTIENRGPIPREFREAVGNRIFGCDDCQEACPWNRFAKRAPDDGFKPRSALRDRPLEAWLRLSPEEFATTFENSAVMRAGWRGFLRNVLVAAGASRDPALLENLLLHLNGEEPLHRAHAAWAIGQLLGPRPRRCLEAALATETDAGVTEEIRLALAASSRQPKT